MWEIRTGSTCEAMQFVITFANGKQVRVFVDGEDVPAILEFPHHLKDIKECVMFSLEDIRVE